MSASHARPLQRSPSVNPQPAPNEMSSSVGLLGSGRTANASRSINRSLNNRLMDRALHTPDRGHVSAVGGFGPRWRASRRVRGCANSTCG